MKKFSAITKLLFVASFAVLVAALFSLPLLFTIPFFAALFFLSKVEGSFGLNSTNNMSARAAFDHARKMFALAMLDKFPNWGAAMEWANSLKLSQNEVRREVQLTVNANAFSFGVTVNQFSQGATGLFNTEVPLQQSDSLCVSEYGIFVRDPASATGVVDPLCTYPDAVQFATANVAGALNTFYDHGQFKITANNDVILPARGLFNHKYAPQTQNGVGITAQTVFPVNQIRGAEDGFITCEPNIVLIGSKNYIPQIVLPAALAAVETYQRAVVIFRGILAQNSTIIN